MLVVTNKRPKTVLVKKDSVDQAGNFLDSLPEKPKEAFSLRAAVDRLREPIRAALAKGYTYEEVAALLAKQGIAISPSTLKNYVPSGSRQAAKTKTAGTKTRQVKATSESTETATTSTQPKATTQTKLDNGESPEKLAVVQPAKQRTRAAAKTKTEPSTKAKTSTKQSSSKPTTAAKSTRTTRKSSNATGRKKSTPGK
jgi:hypothetical protein